MSSPVWSTSLLRKSKSGSEERSDLLVVEEPLEIRLFFGPEGNRDKKSLTVTMRTPGHDFELAIGFLLGEGIIHSTEEVRQIRYCTEPVSPEEAENVLLIHLDPASPVPDLTLQRNFMSTAACGLCGKASLETLKSSGCKAIPGGFTVRQKVLLQMSETAQKAQLLFKHTGGIHAAALFDQQGNLLLLREDIGRHNAVDKVIGAAAQSGLALGKSSLFVSGRAGYELVQKALMAGIPVMAAVGAPSSLSVQIAEAYGLSLIGFLKSDRFNLYTHPDKII